MDAGSTPFDLDPHALRCPYEHYEELREQGAVVPVEELGALAVLGMDDIRTVLRQPGAASSRTPTGPAVAAQIGAALTRLREAGRLPPTAIAYLDGRHDRTLFTIDPPNHTRQRRLMGRLFAPRQVDAWRSVVGPIADDVVSRLVACPGPVDLVTDFAVPIPVAVIATLLRMPVEDHERLKRWSVDVTRIIGNPQADDEAFARSVAARQEMAEYFGARLDQARDVPGDDLVTAVAEAGIEGEGAGLTESERCGLLINFLTAGNETTTKLLASGAWLLGERPDALGPPAGRAEPRTALSRRCSAWNPRRRGCSGRSSPTSTSRTQTLPAGTHAYLVYAAGNRDPAAFDDPHTFRLDRSNGHQHLSFGHGIHLCLGAGLARMEAQVAVDRAGRSE